MIDLLKKPLVACLISMVAIAASTGYLFIFQDSSTGNRTTGRGTVSLINHAVLGEWTWLADIDYELIFFEDGRGSWIGVADTFEWVPITDHEVNLYVNGVRWWQATLNDDAGILMVSSLMADGVEYQYMRFEDGVGLTNDQLSEEIRVQMARLADGYGGDITIVSSPTSAIAPDLSTFIDTPSIIYNTLGSENGMMDTYMVVEGVLGEWSVNQGFNMVLLSNDEGEIQMFFHEPLVERRLSDYQRMLTEGTMVRMYYQYSGFSGVLDQAAGIAIGFVILEEEVDRSHSIASTRGDVEALDLGDTFTLDGLEITIEDDMRFTSVTRAGSSRYGETVVYFPISVTNVSNRVTNLSTMNHLVYSPDGEQGPCICSDFPDSNIFRIQTIQPGETVQSWLHLLYTTDGEYVIEFGSDIRARRDPGEVEFRFILNIEQ